MKPRRPKLLIASLATACVLSLTINLLQARFIRMLQADEGQPTTYRALYKGQLVPPLEIRELSGEPKVVPFSTDSRPTLIYVFRPGCPWCESNSRSIASLSNQISMRYRIVGLSLVTEGVNDFIKDHHMPFPVYTSPSSRVTSSLHLGVTPQMILISPTGTVVGSWDGAYVGRTKSSIESALSISLPPI